MNTSRKYIEPRVQLISSGGKKLGYYLWLKSRQKILTTVDGDLITLGSPESWYDELPDQFIVGSELVTKTDYFERIDKMNLQYNNGEYLLFEINGSCLFRDILFNINESTQWAESNRFLFSILANDAIYDPTNYPISAEYKDIPEWESQFDRYMEMIKSDPIVDHNRLEMPYSISSRFWYGITRMKLIYLLGYLKFHAPFYYEVYGKQMAELIELDESKLSKEINPLINQYRLKVDPSTVTQGVESLYDVDYVTTEMGLILYSQFIRQSGTVIQGLFDIIEHADASEYSSKVYKGNSIFMIRCRASHDKFMKTISNRLCAFAMSSGNDPCSWNYFISKFISDDLPLSEFRKLLPCKFNGNKLVNCKFHDDIKFRNEGKEVSNCPCPLVTKSLTDAMNKLQRDRNSIGRKFYKLTESMVNGGLQPVFHSGNHWTSPLTIFTDIESNIVELPDAVTDLIYEITDKYSKLFRDGITDCTGEPELVSKYSTYALGNDYTCMMKGYFIDKVSAELLNQGIDKFLINFGGDIFARNIECIVNLQSVPVDLNMSGTWSVFTSGNNDKRGNHIKGCPENTTHTIIVSWDDCDNFDNTVVDILATKSAANYEYFLSKEEHQLIDMINRLSLHHTNLIIQNGKILSPTYCASPFFNPDQTEIRDNMIKLFDPLMVFRPDLTKVSIIYNEGHDEYARDVVEDNLYGIASSQYLVYPQDTSDLGTLFEVGVALSKAIPVIKYDRHEDRYQIVFMGNRKLLTDLPSEDDSLVFDCSNKSDVIKLGICSQILRDYSNIYYQLKGCPDNIMLSELFTHVELYDGQFIKQFRDKSDRDQ